MSSSNENVIQIVIKAINNTKNGLTAPITDLNSLGSAFKKVSGLVAGASVAAATAIGIMVDKAIESADAFQKMSERTGVSVESLSTLAHAADLSNVSMEQVETGFKKLSVTMLNAVQGMETAKDTFKTLGITLQDNNGKLKTNEQIMMEVADKFSKMENGAVKANDAVKLFGKAGTDLIPLLNQGADGIHRMQEEAKELGLELSSRTAAEAEKFEDNAKTLGSVMTGFANQIMAFVLPSLLKYQEALIQSTKQGGILNDGLLVVQEVLKGTWRFAEYTISIIGQIFEQVANLASGLIAVAIGFAEGGFKGARAAASAFLDQSFKDFQNFQKRIKEITFDQDSNKEKPRIPGIPTEGDITTAEQRFKELQKLAKNYLATFDQDTNDFFKNFKKLHEEAKLTVIGFVNSISKTFQSGLGQTLGDIFKKTKNLQEAFDDLAKTMLQGLADFIAQKIAAFATEKLLGAAATAIFGAQTAANIAGAEAIASAWAPAAAAVSLASFGANSVAAISGMSAAFATAQGLSMAKFEGGADMIPATGAAILHEGERVVKRDSNEKLTDFLEDQDKGGMTIQLMLDGSVFGKAFAKWQRQGVIQVKMT